MSVFTVISNNTASDKAKPTKDLTYVINADTGETYLDVAGTVAGIDDIIRKPLSAEYTAFEVYAHDTPITKGLLDEQSHINFIGKAGDNIEYEVSASMIETFSIRSMTEQADQDVIVDWGDGDFVYLKDITPVSSSGEWRYTITHTYTKVGTYIVKIFGTTYFGFMTSGKPDTTLLSRIFESDLPTASWIWNFSSVAIHAQRLLRVNLYDHSAAITGLHWSRAFTSAKNLISATGFTAYNTSRNSNYSMFKDCPNLVTCDYRVAAEPVAVAHGNISTFEKCYKLAVDVLDLLPVQGFKSGSTVDMGSCFRAMYAMTAADMDSVAKKLWLDFNVNFINTAKAFELCPADIKSQVPTSWGGTNAYQQHLIDSHGDKDYTAFEVYVTDQDILAGSTEGTVHEQFLGIKTFAEAVNGGMLNELSTTEKGCYEAFIIRSKQSPEENGVVVDWGDESITELSTITTESTKATQLINTYFKYSDTEYRYVLAHTYPAPGIYQVRIYGKDYTGLIGSVQHANYSSVTRICRIFAKDLPVASHISNVSSWCRYANLLTDVDVSGSVVNTAQNTGLLFAQCKNLVKATGFSYVWRTQNSGSMFAGDSALEYTDMYFPMLTRSINSIFDGCTKLAINLADVCYNGIKSTTSGDTLSAGNLFKNCSAITGDPDPNVLWNNPNVTWTDTADAFTGCSDDIRAQVPVSWGGTNTDIVVNGSVADRLRTLEERLNGTSFAVV